MKVTVKTTINAPKEKIWSVMTDISNSDKFISGIEKVEVLENPSDSFVGFKWKETRTMFGKTAEETMWITESEENSYYNVRAESHGSIYLSTIKLDQKDETTELSMEFTGKPQTFGAKFTWALMGWMFKGPTRKALQQDMDDIKKYVEAN